MKNLFTALVFLTLVFVNGGAQAGNNQQNDDLNKSTRTRLQKQKCPDDKIIVQIKNIHLAVRRVYGTMITLGSGEELQDFTDQCDLKIIKDAMGVGNIGFGIQDYSKNPTFGTTYEVYKAQIERAQKEKKIEQRPDGIQKVPFGASEIFVLPLDKAPTENNEPVVFVCSGHEADIKPIDIAFCSVSYILPGGFIFGYDFNRANEGGGSDHFLEMDHDKRENLKSLIDEAKNIEARGIK